MEVPRSKCEFACQRILMNGNILLKSMKTEAGCIIRYSKFHQLIENLLHYLGGYDINRHYEPDEQ
jgi:hypothetical protein